ncbi:MAG: SH3 domain-containing protein [Pseudomonadota bacterium]
MAKTVFRVVAVWAMLMMGVVAPAVAETTTEKARALGVGPVTNLPLPRFVSLRSNEINVRRGPGLDYRKDWVFRRAGLPVRVVAEYGDWRRIVDKDEAGGWVFHALLTGRRTALITEPMTTFRKDPTDAARAIAHAEQGVVARLLACDELWCRVAADGNTGWVRKTAIWGVDGAETFGR